ncbi:amidohydrolase family protein [Nocardia cyriacigeorgica]|uniref:Amidohydrolase family protein n=1 Tax=Nocardia cyriacigeorgica TaxID=135487 RepID=A0A6P1D9N5_9NOCA|nr:amidohydrolase family protein [Nocardia cyriacigeorgica]NEW39685.1 amidohydrolase family protein [Nocardia cyriacigeorgica]NEW46261.1 amidohydrolase family protein [Nocardia cyriacigeorgica]NEW50175.1 amidohydrolase family protein [Nocardia cyriacigeorgica]NEW58737.1 amidohydrolase family protein [Nocardia cyriacigeorgica]
MFDAHVHIIDPRFPLIENEGYLPEPYTIDDYRKRMSRFDVAGGAVVSASFQGSDQSYLRAALAELGEGWVGVTRLPLDTSDEEIVDLDRVGVRALRFNLKRAAADIAAMTVQAIRAYELAGWHVEVYIDGQMLASLQPVILKLPALSIDHLGMSEDGLPYLLDLVDRGARVKATGFGRVDMDVATALRRIHAVSPEALMFGTDLPGTRAGRPFEDSDVDLLCDVVGTDMYKVLEDNARAFYRLPPVERAVQDPDPTLPLHAPPEPTLPLRRSDLPTPESLDTVPLPIVE